ncbi:ABC transporter ATP-binding protein [Cohnella candidum]|uniref:ABC transporter ATP-binding protein n=1 Tax=Cohnella candidum TaxID=2674991 RepID=A0A3G3JY62_9BACL|nr:ABC transporter ATP-binding protein [Cohnella candidum]AYQ72449.1 ABC transporter ATP-binding protein [Cohnella candidum]
MKVLEAFDLYRFYHTENEETLALRGMSLEVHAGEIVAVMGPSGSGKSTLLACLAGLDMPDGGHVELMGKRITRLAEKERSAVRAAQIGILLQSGNLFSHLTVADNIRLQMKLAGKTDFSKVSELLQIVGLADRADANSSGLSGGEAVRAGLAVALSTDPPILLADEPTGEVDAEAERQILRLFDDRRKQGGAILVVTHSEVVAGYADRVISMQDGRMLDESSR